MHAHLLLACFPVDRDIAKLYYTEIIKFRVSPSRHPYIHTLKDCCEFCFCPLLPFFASQTLSHTTYPSYFFPVSKQTY